MKSLISTVLLLLLAVPALAQTTHEHHAGMPADMPLTSSGSALSTADSTEQFGHVFTKPPGEPVTVSPTWHGSGNAETASAYSLDNLLATAQQLNPTLCQARLQISATLSTAMQAGLYPNPMLSYSAEQIGVDGTAGEWHGLTVEQRVVRARKLQLSRSKYRQRAKVAEHLAVAQQYRVLNDVRAHFYEVVAAKRVLHLKQELLKTAEDSSTTVREMYNLGQANRADVHRTNNQLQRHRLAVMMAENNVRQLSSALAAIVGLCNSTVSIEGVLESKREFVDFDSSLGRLLAESPLIAAAQAKLREDCITIQREKVEAVPDLIFSGGSGYNFERQQTVAAAGVALEIPLFNRNQGTIAQAQADWNRQRLEIKRTQLQLQQQHAATFSRYLTAAQNVMNYEGSILPESREAYRLALVGYKENRAEWPDVLEAQTAYTNDRIAHVENLLTRRLAEVSIDGYLLHGGLQAAEGPTPPGHMDSTPDPR